MINSTFSLGGDKTPNIVVGCCWLVGFLRYKFVFHIEEVQEDSCFFLSDF